MPGRLHSHSHIHACWHSRACDTSNTTCSSKIEIVVVCICQVRALVYSGIGAPPHRSQTMNDFQPWTLSKVSTSGHATCVQRFRDPAGPLREDATSHRDRMHATRPCAPSLICGYSIQQHTGILNSVYVY
jgi:hypothetical protein